MIITIRRNHPQSDSRFATWNIRFYFQLICCGLYSRDCKQIFSDAGAIVGYRVCDSNTAERFHKDDFT